MEQWILAGRVLVNGAPATLGARVSAGDLIQAGGRIIRVHASARLPRVLLYHKPAGEIVSADDPQGRTTVFSQLPQLKSSRWVAVGRLDYNTSGLLIFTTSGELAARLMHPRYGIEREYAVRVIGELTADQAARLREGVQLDDGVAHFEAVDDQGGRGLNHWYRVVLREGRNREVRRMFDAVGLTVSRLTRVRYGPISLPARLKRGQWRELEPEEVTTLMAAAAAE